MKTLIFKRIKNVNLRMFDKKFFRMEIRTHIERSIDDLQNLMIKILENNKFKEFIKLILLKFYEEQNFQLKFFLILGIFLKLF